MLTFFNSGPLFRDNHKRKCKNYYLETGSSMCSYVLTAFACFFDGHHKLIMCKIWEVFKMAVVAS